MNKNCYHDALYHHGIRGQKWGTRNGPPYPLGSDDHSAREKKAGWRKSLSSTGPVVKKRTTHPAVEKTTSKGTASNKESNDSKRKFELSDKTKSRIKKGLIIGGVAAGTIGAVYLYRRLGQDYIDKTIKAGTTIQTLAADPNRINNGKHYYTTFLKGDKSAYNKLFSGTYVKRQNAVLTKYRITSTAAKDAKIASNNSARKAYDHLMKTNPEFRKLVRTSFDTSEYTDHGREVKLHNTAKRLLDSGSKRSTYVAFNRSTLLSEHLRGNKNADDVASNKAKKIFFEELKRRGYSGVNDINDQRYSGFKKAAKQPTIIFDNDFLQKTATGGLAYDARKIKLRTKSTRVNKHLLSAGKVYAQTKGYSKAYAPGAVAAVGANYVLKNMDEQTTQTNTPSRHR